MNTPQNTGAADSAQHTAGPWTVRPTGQNWAIESRGYSEQMLPIYVCEAPGHAGRSRANARLIAAAPDLLAALARLADWADQSAVALGDDHPLAAESDWAISAARAAIARAKGGAA